MIVAIAGRRIDPPDARPSKFPPANVDLVAQRIRQLFEQEHVTAVVSSAACGADLVALREARTRQLHRRIVLPFDRAGFRASSVVDRPGDWGAVFDAALDEAEAAGDVVTLGGAPGDAAYVAANAAILDEAQALARLRNEPACALLVWDGVSRGPDDVTAEFGAAAARRGMPVLEVLTMRTCFVIQGFGEKPDLATGRVLNLDASYEVIKEAVEAAGLRCLRADEIVHTGPIDKPMYEWLFKADLVIADLSTSNLNAVYELGVRYGLRPYTTIIVAESGFKNPFDVNHQITRFYEHLGKDLGRKESRRFAEALTSDIQTVLGRNETDSPVYHFVPLQPPAEKPRPARTAVSDDAFAFAAGVDEGVLSFAPPPLLEGSAKALLEQARAAIDGDDFREAKRLLQTLRSMRPRDPYLTQLLALATYRSESPDPLAALKEAHGYLEELDADSSNDPETIGLWATVHQQLWVATKERRFLDRALAAYERGFYVKQDTDNGIQYAFLLNLRARLFQQDGDTAEATADVVLAQRVRREVLRTGERRLASATLDPEAQHRLLATLWEAAVGLGDAKLAAKYRPEAEAVPVDEARREGTRHRIGELEKLLSSVRPT